MSRLELEPLFTLAEVAELARVSLRTVQRAVTDGRLDVVRYGRGTTRVTRQAAVRFLHGSGAVTGGTVDSISPTDRRQA